MATMTMFVVRFRAVPMGWEASIDGTTEFVIGDTIQDAWKALIGRLVERALDEIVLGR